MATLGNSHAPHADGHDSLDQADEDGCSGGAAWLFSVSNGSNPARHGAPADPSGGQRWPLQDSLSDRLSVSQPERQRQALNSDWAAGEAPGPGPPAAGRAARGSSSGEQLTGSDSDRIAQ